RGPLDVPAQQSRARTHCTRRRPNRRRAPHDRLCHLVRLLEPRRLEQGLRGLKTELVRLLSRRRQRRDPEVLGALSYVRCLCGRATCLVEGGVELAGLEMVVGRLARIAEASRK